MYDFRNNNNNNITLLLKLSAITHVGIVLKIAITVEVTSAIVFLIFGNSFEPLNINKQLYRLV